MALSHLIQAAYAKTTNTVNLLVPTVTDGNIDPKGGIEGYVGNIFPTVIKLGVAIAILSMTYWGLRTIISNVPGFKAEGNERMMAALLGLGLLLIAYLILYTINPDILSTSLSSISGK